MKRNTSTFNFSPREYDDQLSPFGRKVLCTLIKQWNIERDRSNNNAPAPAQYQRERRRRYNIGAQNRMLTFGQDDSHTPRVNQTHTFDCHINKLNLIDDVNAENSFDFATEEMYNGAGAAPLLPPAAPAPLVPPALAPTPAPRHLPVPTSTDLMAASAPAPALPSTSTAPVLFPQTHSFTRNDLILSVDEVDCANQKLNSFQYKGLSSNSSIEKERDLGLTSELINNVDAHAIIKRRDVTVNWNNMFDTELFSEADTTPDKLEPIQPRSEKIFQINSGEKRHSVDKQKEKASKKEKAVHSKKVTTKRKIQTQVTEAITKKVKRVVINKPKRTTQVKNCGRAGGYSETVTNWLNYVDPNNPVEDSYELLDNQDDVSQTNDDRRKPEIVVEEAPKTKPIKKVIQAQLANKGGIMKFGKPKNCDASIEEATGSSAEAATTTAEKVKPKEKKSKPKFVAPIKSQTPVTEVSYDILDLADSLVAKYELDGNTKQEIVTVLLYSNGFCQLNGQHTETPCVPEGLLIHIHDELNFYLDGSQQHLHEIVQRVMRSNTVVCYDGKAVLIFLANKFGLELDTELDIIDTKIAGALLDADSPPESFSQLQRSYSASAQSGAGGRAVSGCARSKAAWHAARLRAAAASLRERLQQEQLWELFVDIEMKLVPIVADMERRGVRVDVRRLQELGAMLEARMAAAADACAAAVPPGRTLQLHSSSQLAALLYDELCLHTAAGLQVRHTGATGAKSTDETMLRALSAAKVHPLPALILEYRRLHKAHATFVAGILNHVRDGRVRPVWEQTAAATGRLASSTPNLQAVPKAPLLLTAIGTATTADTDKNHSPAAVDGELSLQLRSVFVCGEEEEGGEEWCVLAADWRHVECRVFARAAGDAAMHRALHAPDLFARLAADWLKKEEAEVSVEERERTKRIVYASLYGAGPRKLMHILGVDYRAATTVAASFGGQFPGVREFGRAVWARCRAAGGRVTSLCARARRLPDICRDEPGRRAHAERQALNFIIQGSAADICKIAMVSAVRELRASGVRARLVLSVHDELVWEVRRGDLPRAAEVIAAAMEGAGARCGIPRLPVAVAVGRSWGELHPYPPTPTAPSRVPSGQDPASNPTDN